MSLPTTDRTKLNNLSPNLVPQQIAVSALRLAVFQEIYTYLDNIITDLNAAQATGAVTTAKLADGSVSTLKLADNAVTGAKLLDAAVIASKLADGSVTTTKVGDGAVVTIKLADGAVVTAKIADLNVTSGKIADNAVISVKLADGAVLSAKIADGAVTAVKIADGTITGAKIADNTITTQKLVDSIITAAKILDGSVTNAKLAPGSVTRDKVAPGVIGSAELDPLLLQNYGDIAVQAKFANLSGNLDGRGINVKYPPAPLVAAKGDWNGTTGTDDTAVIQNIINNAPPASRILFPAGTYKHTGITISKSLFLEGESMNRSILRNTSANDGVTVNNFADTWGISNLNIQGDGATTGNGLTLLHAFNGYIRNAWFLSNKIGIYIQGDTNTIEIDMCRIQQNYLDGVRGYGTADSQINDIRISKSNIQGNLRSGVNLWGNSLSIRDCAIQGNKVYGVEFNASNQIAGAGCVGVSIRDNYFEANVQGELYVKGVASTTNVISGLAIDGNYGFHANVTGINPSSWSNSAVIFDNQSTDHVFSRGIRNLFWASNRFNQQKSTGGAVDFGGNLASDSVIMMLAPGDQGNASSAYLNMGASTKLGTKKRFLHGLSSAKGTIVYSTINKSDNFTTSGSYAIFPIASKDGAWLNEYGFNVTCDSTNYTINTKVIRVDQSGTATDVADDSALTVNGNYTYTKTNKDLILSGDYAYFLRITITFINAATTCAIGNPYLVAND